MTHDLCLVAAPEKRFVCAVLCGKYLARALMTLDTWSKHYRISVLASLVYSLDTEYHMEKILCLACIVGLSLIHI